MRHILRIDELFKSENYEKAIATPYTSKVPVKNSRFVEEKISHTGWRLVGFYPCSPEGNPRGEIIPRKRFEVDNNIDMESIQKALTAGLGQMGNQSWIESYEVPSDREHTLVYLGKLAVEVKGKTYVAVFKIPTLKGIEGETFWMSVTSAVNRDTEEIVQTARAIALYPYDMSDADLESSSRIRVNLSNKKQWEERNRERKEKGEIPSRIPPKQFNELEFSKNFRVIRDTNNKDFFVVWKDTEKGDPIEYSIGVVSGTKKPPRETLARVFDVGTEKMERSYQTFFQLNPTDSRYLTFKYWGKTPNPNLNPNNYTTLRIVKSESKKTKEINPDFREILVEPLTGPKAGKGKFTLKIKPGDRLQVPRLPRGAGVAPDAKPILVEATVLKTENIPANRERIAVRLDEKDEDS